MNLTKIKNNLSFAILVKDIAWRADLTTRYCEYFSNIINEDRFKERVFFPDNVDDALLKCETDYLVIVSSGFIPFNISLFEQLDKIVEQNNQMFIGQVVIDGDFAYLDEQFLFVDKILWAECQCPKYSSSVRSGLLIDSSDFTLDKKIPNAIKKIHSEDNIYVGPELSSKGAAFIIAQLNKFEQLTTLISLDKSGYHFLNNRSPYLEIHSETEFEKLYVEKNRIHALGNIDFSRFERKPLEVLVTPADGIRGIILAQELQVEEVVIFSKSRIALQFQQRLFNLSAPKLFGSIVKEFLEEFKSIILPSNFYEYENHLITPFKGRVEFVITDCTSFEMENLIKSLDHRKTILFDFSNIFVLPHNYYKRPLYQIEALFAEIYSLIKSRTGPSYLSGVGPNFINLYSIDVNTSNAQFNLNIDEALEMEEMPEVFFKPDLSALKIQDEEIKQSWYSSAFKTISDSVDTLIDIKREEEIKASLPKHSNACVALLLDFEYALISEENNIALVVKSEMAEDIEILYFYGINIKTNEWKFFVGKKNTEKRIEFSNGISEESCIKHANLPIKINIKTAIKYLQ